MWQDEISLLPCKCTRPAARPNQSTYGHSTDGEQDPEVGSCFLAQVIGSIRGSLRAVYGGQQFMPDYDVRLLHDSSLCHMHLAAATCAGDINRQRTLSSHGATSANYSPQGGPVGAVGRGAARGARCPGARRRRARRR